MYVGGARERREMILAGDPLDADRAGREVGPARRCHRLRRGLGAGPGSGLRPVLESGLRAPDRGSRPRRPAPWSRRRSARRPGGALLSYIPGSDSDPARSRANRLDRRTSPAHRPLRQPAPALLDSPMRWRRLRRSSRAIQEALYRYEGSLNKLSVDEKGTMLLAALGLPPLAHPDDARRGLMAAGPSVRPLVRLGVRSARSGWRPAGSIAARSATPGRREYTVIGRSVNLAARLHAGGPGARARSSATRRHPRRPRLLRVRGACPQAAQEHRGARAALSAPRAVLPCGGARPTIGRSAERSRAADRLDTRGRGRRGAPGHRGGARHRQVAARRGPGRPGRPSGGRHDDRPGRRHRADHADHAWRPLFSRLLGLDDDPARRHGGPGSWTGSSPSRSCRGWPRCSTASSRWTWPRTS